MKRLHAWIEQYFPCPFERGGSFLVIVGVLSTVLYVFTKITFKSELSDLPRGLRDLPQNIMLLTFFVSAWSQRYKLKSDLVFGLMILSILIPLILLGINALLDYESANKYRSLRDLLKLFLFLPLAWWIGGSRAGAFRIMTIALLGLVTAIALDPNLMQSLKSLWSGLRVDFGIHNAQHGALFFGLVIIFCICVFSQRVTSESKFSRVDALILMIGLFALTGLVGTQTRAAILGLIVCALIVLIQGFLKRNDSDHKRILTRKGILVLVVISVFLAWSGKEILYDRFVAENTYFQNALAGDMDELHMSGIAIRLHSWDESLKWIAQKPFTGWGLEAREDVIQLGERFPDEFKALGFRHLHNGYLELVLGFGVTGLVFLGVVWIVLLRRIKATASREFYAFALYGGLFFLVLNLFESFFFKWSGEFALALIMAGGYSQYLASSLTDRESCVSRTDIAAINGGEQGT